MPFCHVAGKEGCKSIKVANVSDFWRAGGGQTEIKVLDPNITACREKRDLMAQYRDTGVWIDFTQGLDIRCINSADIEDLNGMKIQRLHFAWDDPNDNLEEKFRAADSQLRVKDHRRRIVYCLTGYENVSTEEHIERALHRIYLLRDMNYDPFVMVYDKPHAPKELKQLQRWCNNKIIFGKCKSWGDYLK